MAEIDKSSIFLQLLQAQINYIFIVKVIPAKITALPRLDTICYSRGSCDHVVTVLEHLVHRTKASTLIMALMLF